MKIELDLDISDKVKTRLTPEDGRRQIQQAVPDRVRLKGEGDKPVNIDLRGKDAVSVVPGEHVSFRNGDVLEIHPWHRVIAVIADYGDEDD